MLTLIAGLGLFLGVHMVPALPSTRAGMVERFGSGAYKILFTLASFAGLALIVLGYQALRADTAANIQLWDPPTWTRHLAYALMLPAMIFVVAGQIPSRIRTALKHPMLVGIKTWALAHLLANGDLASVLLFGSFLAYAVFDRISLKKRASLGPLGDKTGAPVNDLIVVGLGVALYALFVFWAHGALIGVALAG